MSTQPDPVAEKSGFLRMYMSNHPDTLVAYAKWYGKVKEAITGAEMTAIDTKVRVPLQFIATSCSHFRPVTEYDVGLHSQKWCQERGAHSYRASSQRLRGRQTEAAGNEGAGPGGTRHGESNAPYESNPDH